MIHGVNIVFPTTAIVVCFRYFFILSNLKDAPSSISESGVAIFETSLIVFSIAVGILILRSKVSIPKQDAIISGFFIIPIDIFLKSGLPPLKVSSAITDKILNSVTITAIKRAATPTFSLPNKDSVIGIPNITKLLLNSP